MADTIFCDGIEKFSVSAGMVRLELFVLGPPMKGGGEPARVPTVQLVMPTDGFIQAFNGLSQLMKQMVDKGVVTRRAPAQAKADGDAARAEAPKRK